MTGPDQLLVAQIADAFGAVVAFSAFASFAGALFAAGAVSMLATIFYEFAWAFRARGRLRRRRRMAARVGGAR